MTSAWRPVTAHLRDERRPHRGGRPDRARDRASEGAVHTTPHRGDTACRTRAQGFAAAAGSCARAAQRAGESGSGKTTTARMIARLLDQSAGTVTFDGIDIGTASFGRRRAASLRHRPKQDVRAKLRQHAGALVETPRSAASRQQGTAVHAVPWGHLDRAAATISTRALDPVSLCCQWGTMRGWCASSLDGGGMQLRLPEGCLVGWRLSRRIAQLGSSSLHVQAALAVR